MSLLHPFYFVHSQRKVFMRFNAWVFFLNDYPSTRGACMRVLKFQQMQSLRARNKAREAHIQFADADAGSTDANCVLRWFEIDSTSHDDADPKDLIRYIYSDDKPSKRAEGSIDPRELASRS